MTLSFYTIIWTLSNIDTKKQLDIDFSTGKFGGTMVGDGMEIRGSINLKPQIPQYNLHLNLDNVLPSSLGICLLYTSDAADD